MIYPSNSVPYLGTRIPPSNVAQPPFLSWDCRYNIYYTIICMDVTPLGPQNPSLLSTGIFWYVVDVPGCDLSNGTTLFQYHQPIPLDNTGYNTYTCVVYEQPSYSIEWYEPHISST